MSFKKTKAIITRSVKQPNGTWKIVSRKKGEMSADKKNYPKEQDMSIKVMHNSQGYTIQDDELGTRMTYTRTNPDKRVRSNPNKRILKKKGISK